MESTEIRSQLLRDADARPELFHWNGRMTPDALREWLAANTWLGTCPVDLLAFWQETGGGDVFETETLLGPLGDTALGDDITGINAALRARGMPAGFHAFHVGAYVSAVDSKGGDYVVLDASTHQVLERFASLDGWYEETLRKEYRRRYALK